MLEFSPQLWWAWTRPLWFQYRTVKYFASHCLAAVLPANAEKKLWEKSGPSLYKEIEARTDVHGKLEGQAYSDKLIEVFALDKKLRRRYDEITTQWFGDTADYHKRLNDVPDDAYMQSRADEEVLKSK